MFAEDSCDSHRNCTSHPVCCKGTSYPWRIDSIVKMNSTAGNRGTGMVYMMGRVIYGYSCTRLSDCGFLKDGDSCVVSRTNAGFVNSASEA